MCGILGASFESNNFALALKHLQNRGPDFNKIIKIKNNNFGHTRLSIVDLDDEANQPMVYDDIVLVFNGEIYNYKELIKEENLSCKTLSDTEVIIRLYQKYEFNFLNKLNGMFAFCLYDIKKDRFFCARDRYGKKPFFYHFKDNKFIFSSSLKSVITILRFTPSLNKVALSKYMQYFVSFGEDSFYTGIKKLESSSYLVYENKQILIKKYYQIKTYKKIKDEKTALKDIEELLFTSIQKRISCDEEVGSLLSGGMDSSLISSLYSRISQKTINTFSVGYEGYDNYCELKYASITAKAISSNHHTLQMTQKDFEHNFDHTLDALEEPHGDSASIPLYCLSKQINSAGIKTVLSGEGSDELFLGYDNYSKFLKYYAFEESLSKGQNDFLNTIISSLQTNTKESDYLRRIVKKENLYNSFGEIYTNIQKKKLFNNVPHFKMQKAKKDPIDWMSYIDIKIWLGEALLSKVDRICMSNSLEVRMPFLDFNLVDYVFSIDSKLKIGNTNKYLLKKIAKQYIPDIIVNRVKKGFNYPYNEWMFKVYHNSILDIILEVNKETNLFNVVYIKHIYSLAQKGKFKQHLWSLFIFSKWYKRTYL